MIYLHFLDRELRESVDLFLSKAEMNQIINCAFFLNFKKYGALSHVFESFNQYSSAIDGIRKLNIKHKYKLLSTHKSIKDFIQSRKDRYAHDKSRYDCYFKKSYASDYCNIEWKKPKKTTTKVLSSEVFTEELIYNSEVTKSLREFLASLNEEAITISVFKSFIHNLDPKIRDEVEQILRVKISKFYVQRYLDYYEGESTIITGIPGLKEYDELVYDQLKTNYQIYKSIFNKINIDLKSKILTDIFLDSKIKRPIKILSSIMKLILNPKFYEKRELELDDVIELIEACKKNDLVQSPKKISKLLKKFKRQIIYQIIKRNKGIKKVLTFFLIFLWYLIGFVASLCGILTYIFSN